MRLPEVHVWQDTQGRVERVEFKDGPQRIELLTSKLVRTDEVDAPSSITVTLLAKPIYHVIPGAPHVTIGEGGDPCWCGETHQGEPSAA